MLARIFNGELALYTCSKFVVEANPIPILPAGIPTEFCANDFTEILSSINNKTDIFIG